MQSQSKKVEHVDLGFVSISLVKPQIVCITCQEELIIDVANGIKILDGIKTLVGEDKYATIINAKNLYAPANEFYKFIISQRTSEKNNIIARALVTTNIAQRIDSQNFINFFKPLTPTKLFSSIEDAIAWIEPLLNTEI